MKHESGGDMEIGLVYSSKDPRQTEARDFVHQYIQEHGILARVVETEEPVQTPRISVDGCCITSSPAVNAKGLSRRMKFPSLDEIAAALEEHVWSL
jgi:hypothetical protein